LVNKYGGSVAHAVYEVFPSHNWVIWKFGQVPKGFWESQANQRAYCEWLAEQLGIKTMDEWYGVTAEQFHQHNGSNASISNALAIRLLLLMNGRWWVAAPQVR
jgi:hypothetical protein